MMLSANIEQHSGINEFVATAERAVATGDLGLIADADVERVMTAALRLYAAKVGAGRPVSCVVADQVTPTEVVTLVSDMLHAVDLNLFDLAMWFRRAQ